MPFIFTKSWHLTQQVLVLLLHKANISKTFWHWNIWPYLGFFVLDCRNKNILHLLDDFLTTIDPPDIEVKRTMFLCICLKKNRNSLVQQKTMAFCTELKYFEITLDTEKMETWLPEENVTRITKLGPTILT